LNFFFDRANQGFPFHTLAFAFWLIMKDPSFVTSDNEVQKGITFHMILAQKVATYVESYAYAVP
jgi:hypothetical protein